MLTVMCMCILMCTGNAQLILANHEDIRSFSLDGGDRSSLFIRNLHNCIALDYHYQYGYLYWTDVSLDIIKRSTLTGEHITTVVDKDLENPGECMHNLCLQSSQ